MKQTALAPTTGAQRKLGDSMHWMMFHTSDGLSEQWECGNSAVILPDRSDASPFVKGYWREIGPFMLAMGAQIPGYRIIPEETAAAYLAARDTFFGPKERDDPEATMKNWTRLEDAEENLAVALGGTRLLPPRPAWDGGLSPSPLAAIDDKTAAVMSEVIDHEPGFHQVNPINQRKAAAPDFQVGDRVRLTAKGKRWFCEEGAPEHVLATISGHRTGHYYGNDYRLQFDDPTIGSLSSWADKHDFEPWPPVAPAVTVPPAPVVEPVEP